MRGGFATTRGLTTGIDRAERRGVESFRPGRRHAGATIGSIRWVTGATAADDPRLPAGWQTNYGADALSSAARRLSCVSRYAARQGVALMLEFASAAGSASPVLTLIRSPRARHHRYRGRCRFRSKHLYTVVVRRQSAAIGAARLQRDQRQTPIASAAATSYAFDVPMYPSSLISASSSRTDRILRRFLVANIGPATLFRSAAIDRSRTNVAESRPLHRTTVCNTATAARVHEEVPDEDDCIHPLSAAA